MIAPMNLANTKILAESLPARYSGTDRPIEISRSFLLLKAKITGFNLLFRLAERHEVWPDLKIAFAGIERPAASSAEGRYAQGKSSETPNWWGPDES